MLPQFARLDLRARRLLRSSAPATVDLIDFYRLPFLLASLSLVEYFKLTLSLTLSTRETCGRLLRDRQAIALA